jgi:hypothetical protein
MQVNLTSPVDAEAQPYLHKWDSATRNYFTYYEVQKKIARDNLISLRSNPLTNWKNTVQMRTRVQAQDELIIRQQLGDISKSEVKELNRVFGNRHYLFTKTRGTPAHITAYNTLPLLTLLGAGSAFGLYGKFVKGFNVLWLPAIVGPLVLGLLVNAAR